MLNTFALFSKSMLNATARVVKSHKQKISRTLSFFVFTCYRKNHMLYMVRDLVVVVLHHHVIHLPHAHHLHAKYRFQCTSEKVSHIRYASHTQYLLKFKYLFPNQSVYLYLHQYRYQPLYHNQWRYP